MTSEHTKTPWFCGPTPVYLRQGQEGTPITIRSAAHTEEIATVWTCLLPTEANARHIVHCVNTHDELVAALERCFDQLRRMIHDDHCYREHLASALHIPSLPLTETMLDAGTVLDETRTTLANASTKETNQ